MANYAPLRELCVRVFGTRALFEQYMPKAPVSAGILGPLLQGPEDKRMNAAYRELDAQVRKEFAKLVEHAIAQARRMDRQLRGIVKHPSEEQDAVVEHLLLLRSAVTGGHELPPLQKTVEVAARLWRLGDERHEPTKFVIGAQPPNKVGRKPGNEKAIDFSGLAVGLIAVQEGRANSVRALAELLGTSSASVGRNQTLREALLQQKRPPRARGFKKAGGGVEAIDPSANETGNETADS